jgi:hypothetical protein
MTRHRRITEMNTETATTKPRMTRSEVVEHLREHGFPIGLATLDKLCAPACNEGPKPCAWWGSRPLYDPDEALAWAESRLTASAVRLRGRPRKVTDAARAA